MLNYNDDYRLRWDSVLVLDNSVPIVNISTNIQISNSNKSFEVVYNPKLPEIRDVIFNPPATIVFWTDNTKTVVKCEEDDYYNPETAMLWAMMKKIRGNTTKLVKQFEPFVEKYEEKFE